LRGPVCVFGYVTKEWEIYGGGIVREIVAGGAYFVSHALRSLGMDVTAIVRLAQTESYLLADLKARGINVVPVWSSRTMMSKLIYEPSGERRIEVVSLSDPFTVEDLDKCLYADAIYIGPQTEKDFDLEFIETASHRAPVYLDVQGFTRRVVGTRIVYVDWEWKRAAAPYIGALKVDDREARLLTGESDPGRALKSLHDIGFREIVMTTDSGVYVSIDGDSRYAPYRIGRVVGRTGRGDTAIAAYIASKIMGLDLEKRAILVAAAVSMKLMSMGPLTTTMNDVARFVEQNYGVSIA